MTEYLHPSLENIGIKNSDMRFATKPAFRRFCIKAELIFDPYIL